MQMYFKYWGVVIKRLDYCIVLEQQHFFFFDKSGLWRRWRTKKCHKYCVICIAYARIQKYSSSNSHFHKNISWYIISWSDYVFYMQLHFSYIMPLLVFCYLASQAPCGMFSPQTGRLTPNLLLIASSALPPKLQTKTQISLAFCYFLLIPWTDKYSVLL